jgi:hypothetical protein
MAAVTHSSAPTIAVVLRDDPRKTHRPVEGLRIALGLSTGSNPLTVVLLDHAPLLLSEDPEDLMDGEILETHLPAIKDLELSFVVPHGTLARLSLDPAFRVREASHGEISTLIGESNRVLVF